MTILFSKAIDRLLCRGRSVHFRGGSRGDVLLSYVVVPSFEIPGYFRNSHNNRFFSWTMVRAFRAMGYNVHLYDYRDENIDFSLPYKLFLGHNITFSRIGAQLPRQCRKVLITTGCYPQFGNEMQRLRTENLFQRRHLRIEVYKHNIVPECEENLRTADEVLMLGNEFVRQTWTPHLRVKPWLINNVSCLKRTRRQDVSGNFLFLSSVGQVHRGLDLVLDVFVNRPNKLYVCSSFESEKDFVEGYRKELYNTPNIVPVGFVGMESRSFKSIVQSCDFVISPSCSEGQSSSVINAMTKGLIPVVTQNSGIPNIEEIGVHIKEGSIDAVDRAVTAALQLSPDDLHLKRAKLWTHCEKYTAESLITSIQTFAHQLLK